MNKEIKDLVKLSKYAGERFDYVQGAGGNTSVKLNDSLMLIKASGYILSELTETSGFVSVDYKKAKSILTNNEVLSIHDKHLRESKAASLTQSCTTEHFMGRPSIETLLHAVLDTYTLHTHPISVNHISTLKNWYEKSNEIVPNTLNVTYATPGLELTLELLKGYENIENQEVKVIILQNHGLIVSGKSAEAVIDKHEEVCDAFNTYLGLSADKYKVQNTISEYLLKFGDFGQITHLVDSKVIYDFINSDNYNPDYSLPLTPDYMVYCGYKMLELQSINDLSPIDEYFNTYKELPKVIKLINDVYIIASNIKKAKEAEEVLKSQFIIAQHLQEVPNRISNDELEFLSNWEAEKYRLKN